MSIQLGSAYGKVTLDTSGMTKGVNSAKSSLQNLSEVGIRVGQNLQKIGAAMTLAFTVPIVAFGVSAVKSAMDAENALAEMNAVLKSTNGVAGMTADELMRMASQLQRVTKFSDEEIMKGQSMLLTFTNIGKNVFPVATEAMLNMAEKFGSVEEASIQLGKALNDPISGVTALRRVGVMLSNAQEQQIKNFMATNDIASAQKVILGELETEFGGLAKAAGTTTAGKFAILNNALDDLKEKIGTAILPVLIQGATALIKLVDAFLGLPPGVQKGILVIGGLGLIFLAILGPMIAFIGTLVSMASSIMGVVSALTTAGVVLPSLGAVLSGVGALMGAVGTAALSLLGSILLLAAGPAILYFAFKYNFGGIRTTAEQLWFILKYQFSTGWASLKASTADGWANMTASIQSGAAGAQNIFSSFIAWMQGAWTNLVTAMGRYAALARDWIVRTFQIDWGALGRNIIMGIINGFIGGINALVAAAKMAAQAALNAIKQTLGIHSPSAVMMKLGMQTAQGYMLGINGGINPNAIAQMMARPVMNTNSSNQQTFNQYFSSGLTFRQAQAMISQNNEQLMDTFSKMLIG